MGIKLIATDLDGTLFDEFNHLPQENIQAILDAQAKGVEFIVATGRAIQEVPQEILDLGIRYVVALNGAYVYDSQEKQLLHEKFLSKEDALPILNLARDKKLLYNALVDDTLYLEHNFENIMETGLPQRMIDHLKEVYVTVDDINSLVENCKIGVGKILMFFNSLEAKSEFLTQINVDDYEICSSFSGESLEFNKRGATKGYGVEMVSKIKNIPLSQIATIGDSDNDLSMLSLVENSYGMANGSERVKQTAKFMTKSNTDCGFAHAVYDMISK